MEGTVNGWLKEHSKVTIKFVTQSESMGNVEGDVSVTITIFYVG